MLIRYAEQLMEEIVFYACNYPSTSATGKIQREVNFEVEDSWFEFRSCLTKARKPNQPDYLRMARGIEYIYSNIIILVIYFMYVYIVFQKFHIIWYTNPVLVFLY